MQTLRALIECCLAVISSVDVSDLFRHSGANVKLYWSSRV